MKSSSVLWLHYRNKTDPSSHQRCCSSFILLLLFFKFTSCYNNYIFLFFLLKLFPPGGSSRSPQGGSSLFFWFSVFVCFVLCFSVGDVLLPFFFIFNASALTSTFCSFFCFLKILYRNTQDLKLVGQILDVISFSLHVITAEIRPDILWLFLERRAAPENNVWCFIHYHICALEETTIKTEKVNLISSHWFVSHRMKRAVDIFLYHFSLFFSVLHLDWSIQ